ncbi:hypothetical protein ACIQNI_08870 [Streptomyces sp. NPDC091266]|uniref:hypothetical protein n=1 Tax=Streptomyces sp. NPDC091266 TaxID=3365978 RepID=UPI00381D386D
MSGVEARQQQSQRGGGLLRHHAIAKGFELRCAGQTRHAGHMAGVKAHEPLDERRI